jgi:hypothetical protein
MRYRTCKNAHLVYLSIGLPESHHYEAFHRVCLTNVIWSRQWDQRPSYDESNMWNYENKSAIIRQIMSTQQIH